jgi:hypothetical protein
MPHQRADTGAHEMHVVRTKAFNIRIDSALFEAAKAKARGVGLGPVIRALLKAYIRGDVEPKPADLDSELATAPKGPPRRKPRKK